MKVFVLLIIVAFVCAFLFMRLRPYYLLAKRMLNLARDAQTAVNINTASQPARRAQPVADKLSKCSVCGTWTPSSRVLALRSSSSVYCSQECLENAASITKQSDKRRVVGR